MILALAGAIAVAPGLAQPALAATYAVVVGIDDYANFSDLDGAVNDARDISRALKRRGADVTTLTDERATRSAVVGAVRSQLAKTSAGDVFVFTYAGHGVQLPEALVGDEADGRDESFVLYGFAQSGPGAAERLRDNDIAMLLRGAPEGVSVLFVADSCHSGTMTRAPIAGGDLGRTRFLDLGEIEDDPLPPPDPLSFQLGLADMPHVVFAAAARDDEQTPEVMIDERRRGALSWSVARAIEGAAAGGDDKTSLSDFREFVRAQVRAFSGARQTPDVEFGGAESEGVAAFFSGEDPGEEAEEDGAKSVAAPPSLSPAPPPNLHIAGGDAALSASFSEIAALSATADQATLVWDPETGRLIDRISADLIAEAKTAEDVFAAISKWRAVAGLARWSPRRAFDLATLEGDRRHMFGAKVRFQASAPQSGPAESRLTLFNLASGGEVQYVYPGPQTAAKGGDVIRRGAAPKVIGPSVVGPPAGADHLIGVLTAGSADELREALRKIDGTRAPDQALAALLAYAGDPTKARVAVLPLFSASEP